MIDTSSWSWDERMGKIGTDHLSDIDREELAILQAEMELARLMYVEAKNAYDRACDAVYVFVRSKRESQ